MLRRLAAAAVGVCVLPFAEFANALFFAGPKVLSQSWYDSCLLAVEFVTTLTLELDLGLTTLTLDLGFATLVLVLGCTLVTGFFAITLAAFAALAIFATRKAAIAAAISAGFCFGAGIL